MSYRLSASTLNLFLDCPRCFWLKFKKKKERPRGIFPSLPSGIDNVLKVYFDGYREKGTLPKELQKEIPNSSLYPDQVDIKKWRDWRTGLRFVSPKGVELIGAFDDLLVHKGDVISPLDYKTRGYPPKSIIDSEKYYGLQLSVYSLILKQNKYKVSGQGYLIYYYPKEVSDDGMIQFNIKPVRISADPKYAIETCTKAIEVLETDSVPKASPGCIYCSYIESMI